MYIDDVAIDITSISREGKHNRIQSLHTDRLGSTVGVFNTSGYLHESRSYDAFGTPRGSLNSDRFNAILGSTVSPRGFTQHEHLDGAQLIHMNGRVYDYHLGRFLSVDPFIQGMGNSQGVNPYSYILNNPLAGTDPSGYVAITGLDRWSGMPDPMGYGDNCPFCVDKDKDKEGQDNGAEAGGQASLNITITADNASVGSGNVSGIGGQAQVGTSQEVIKHSNWGIWDSIQAGLDVAGLVPIIGELADLTNAGISLARGDYEGAVLSLSAMVPIVGNAAGTAKIIRSAEKFTDSNIVTKSVNPNSIRFSQSSVSGADNITQSMKANGWAGDPIDVVRISDGGLTTLDNTRVLASSRANINVQANIRNASDALPANLVERFTTKKGVPSTWGDAVNLRIGKQNAGFRNTHPNG